MSTPVSSVQPITANSFRVKRTSIVLIWASVRAPKGEFINSCDLLCSAQPPYLPPYTPEPHPLPFLRPARRLIRSLMISRLTCNVSLDALTTRLTPLGADKTSRARSFGTQSVLQVSAGATFLHRP